MKKIALVFPGQGSHYVGMGKDLCNRFNVAKNTFEEANDVLGFDLKKLCFQGSLLELSDIRNVLSAIFTMSVASFRAYMEEIGISPICSAGHSLGEFSALTCAGVIKFSDALKIVELRSRFAEEVNGSMTVVSGVKSKIVEKECRNVTNDIAGAYIACYNSPFQVMVSGNSDEVLRLEDRIIEIPGAQITPLMNGAPFHSPIMKEAALKLKYELSKYKFDRAEWPVISNFTARPYDNDKEKIIDNIVNQLISPVRWQDTMEYLKKQKVEAVVEIGPKAVLCNLVKENSKDIDAFSYENIDDINSIVKLSKEVKAINIPDQNFITRCLVAAVSTKNRNWDNAKYKKGVIDSYRFIEEMQNNLESENLQPTKEQMLILLEHLKKILITKKLPQEKQLEIFNKIFSDTGTSDYFHNFEI